MTQEIELGLDTFGDIQAGPDGQPLSHAQVIRNVVDEGVLADQSGVFCIGLGEHHRPDFAISSPEALLAAIGARTKHIRLASSVTVLSSDDPVRVFERFSTVNAVSNGRAEVILGRGFALTSISTIGPSHNLAGRFVKSACTPMAMSPEPMKKHETNSGQTIKRCAIGLAPNVAGRR